MAVWAPDEDNTEWWPVRLTHELGVTEGTVQTEARVHRLTHAQSQATNPDVDTQYTFEADTTDLTPITNAFLVLARRSASAPFSFKVELCTW